MFREAGIHVPAVVMCGKYRESAGREAGVYHSSPPGSTNVVALSSTEAVGRDGVQVTRTEWDYANYKTGIKQCERIGHNQYLTQCRHMSWWVHHMRRPFLFWTPPDELLTAFRAL